MFYKIGLSSLSADIDGITMLIEAKYNDFSIGYIKAVVNSVNDSVELDTAVDEEYRGKGIASALLKDMLDKVFIGKYLDVMCNKFAKGTETQKVVLNIDMDNFASRKVAEKLGFVNIGASSHDSVEYVLTKKDYLNRCNSENKSKKLYSKRNDKDVERV